MPSTDGMPMMSNRPTLPSMTSTMNTMTTTNMIIPNTNEANPPSMHTTIDTSSSTSSDDTGSSAMTPISTNPSMQEKPTTILHDETQYPTITTGSMPTITNTMYPNKIDSTKPTTTTTTTTIVKDRYHPSTSTAYDSHSGTDFYLNDVKPSIYDGIGKPDDFNYPYSSHYHHNHHKYHSYQDIYPLYSYSSMFENPLPLSNYLPNDHYAPNIPAIGYHPSSIDYFGSTPSLNNYNIGSTIPTGSTTTYMGNGWSNVDEINNRHKQQHGQKYPFEGKYNVTDTALKPTVPYIRTYFNPDDYYIFNSKCEYNKDLINFSIDINTHTINFNISHTQNIHLFHIKYRSF